MSQENDILSYLQSGKSLTPILALNLFGCFRLGARIWNLKKKGYPIKEADVRDGKKRYARYYIEKPEQEPVYREIGKQLAWV